MDVLEEAIEAANAADDADETSQKTVQEKRTVTTFIEDKKRRGIAFSKRKQGILRKAHELTSMTGCSLVIVVKSETGNCFSLATHDFSSIIHTRAGRNFIRDAVPDRNAKLSFMDTLVTEREPGKPHSVQHVGLGSPPPRTDEPRGPVPSPSPISQPVHPGPPAPQHADPVPEEASHPPRQHPAPAPSRPRIPARDDPMSFGDDLWSDEEPEGDPGQTSIQELLERLREDGPE